MIIAMSSNSRTINNQGKWQSKKTSFLSSHIPDVQHGRRIAYGTVLSIPTPISPPRRSILRGSTSKHPPSRKEKEPEPFVIDLTNDHARYVPDYACIRSANDLFFSYDPRGYNVLVSPLPSDFCTACRCPSLYCADIVFGPMCYTYVENMIYKEGMDKYGKDDVRELFNRVYTDAVQSKMMWNNISFHGFNYNKFMKVPVCLKRGNVKKLITAIVLEQERQQELIWCGDTDLSEKSRKKARKTTDTHKRGNRQQYTKREVIMVDMDEEDVLSTSVARGSKCNPERTAIEQAPDAGAAFRLLKQIYVKSKSTTEEDV